MSSQEVIKTVSKKLKYYFEIKRLEDGFDLSGVDCPRLDHPPLKARPTLMYDGLHDRPLKHYFSRGEVRTTLTQFKTKGGKNGREKQIKSLLERYMKKYQYVERAPSLKKDSSLNAAFYTQNKKKGSYKLKPELQGYGIPLKKTKSPHKGGYTVLRSVPHQYTSRAEAHRIVNMASRILLATETIDLDEKDGKQNKRPQSAPKSFESDERESLPRLQEKKRPQTSKTSRENKMYTVAPSGRKVFVKYNDREPNEKKKRNEEQADSAYSTRPGSTSPNHIYNIEGDAVDDEDIKPWLRNEIRKSGPADEEDEWVRPGSPHEPRPPSRSNRVKSAKTRQPIVVEQMSPRDRSDSNSSMSTDSSAGREKRDRHQTQDTQTGGELLHDYDPTERILRDGETCLYRVHVFTGVKIGSGTKADVKIALVGDKGRTEESSLQKSKTHKVMFQKGQEDIFDLECYHVGPIRKIFIGHDRTEMGSDWYVERVMVKDMDNHYQYTAVCNTWLSYRADDKSTYKGFPVESFSSFSPEVEEERNRQYGDQPQAHIAIVHTTPRVEQAEPIDDRSFKTGATKSKHSTSTETQYSDRKPPPSMTDTDTTDTTYTTTSYTDSTVTDRNRDKEVVSPRAKHPPRRDDFFDQRVVDKDYSSVIESLSVTTDQDNKDDFDNDRPVYSRRDNQRSSGVRVRPVEGRYEGDRLDDTAVLSRDDVSEDDPHETAHIAVRQDDPDSGSEDKYDRDRIDQHMVQQAAKSGDFKHLKHCLDQRPDLKSMKDEHGWTLLHTTAAEGHDDITQWLTVQVVDLEAETSKGYTPLHLAAMGGHLGCVRVIFAMGAAINSRTHAGETSLHLATENGQHRAVKYLLANGADVNIRTVSGKSALNIAEASIHPGAEQCKQYLLQHEAKDDPNNSYRSKSPVQEDKRPQSASSVDSSSSSSSSSGSSDSSQSTPRNTEPDPKTKEKHDAEIMEKRRIYDEQQAKMSSGQMTFMDTIRSEVD